MVKFLKSLLHQQDLRLCDIVNCLVLSKVIRDYHTAFGYRPIYQPELIMQRLKKRAINKMPCYNLFITHSNPLFTEFYLKETTDVLATEVMLEDV